MELDICLPTYRRPKLLAAQLESLRAMDKGGFTVNVLVVDNDSEGSARPVAQAFDGGGIRVVYLSEPLQGHTPAINCALKNSRAEYLAIVDDDEQVAPDWLVNMYAAMQRHGAGVVFGRHRRVLPADAPAWARWLVGFWGAEGRRDGEPMAYGGGGNVLMRRAALGDPLPLFDMAYSRIGGGDTDYFYRLHLQGVRMVYCATALIEEPVPKQRLSLRWVFLRAFRCGQTYMQVFFPRARAARRADMLARMAVGLIARPILALLCLPFSRALALRLAVAAAGDYGKASTFVSRWRYEEYDGVANP